MDISFACVFLCFLLNYGTKIPLGIAMAKSGRGYNNRYPRDQQAELAGWGKRALGAHLNGFETAPAFASAVIIAHLSSVSADTLTLLSIAFIALRIMYIILYLANKSSLRSLVWFLGIICIVTIFWLSIFK